MKKIKPKSAHEVYGAHEGKEKSYPEFTVHHDQFPEAKDWEVGKKYTIKARIKKVDHSESKFGEHSGFEIHEMESMPEESHEKGNEDSVSDHNDVADYEK